MIKEDSNKDTDKGGIRFNYFMVYMGGEGEGELQILLEECKGHAVLDCGCPHTVCGEKLMQDYFETLSKNDQKELKIMKSNQSFTFGDGRGVSSKRKMRIPVRMGGVCSSSESTKISNLPCP